MYASLADGPDAQGPQVLTLPSPGPHPIATRTCSTLLPDEPASAPGPTLSLTLEAWANCVTQRALSD